MDIRPIRTERDYERALRRIEALMDAGPGTDEGDELDVLATLVEVYEEKQFPMDVADPVDAILFRMEQQELDRKDLEAFIGSRHRVSEILNRKRGLSLDMIRRLHAGLGIPLEVLVGEAA
ncbi:MAG: transcriptional regulator [Gammaproteobacteria bacterium]|nr:transcriptional regulator [Gammaproteobacteria bacterium]